MPVSCVVQSYNLRRGMANSFHLIAILAAAVILFTFISADDDFENSDDDCWSMCTNDFKPVCGSNSETYPNLCHLRCAAKTETGLQKASDNGNCKKDKSHRRRCKCNSGGTRVCGTNGQTYKSHCLFRCARKRDKSLKLRSREPCSFQIKRKLSRTMSNNYNGTEEIPTTLAPGEDEGSCVCPRIYSPVCGTNGLKYANMCELRCIMMKDDSVKLAYRGACKPNETAVQGSRTTQDDLPIKNDECTCSEDLPTQEVCASNDEVFKNECLFQCAEFKDPSLFLVSEGKCRARNPIPEDETPSDKEAIEEACKCSRNDLPESDNEAVCSGDGVTYKTKCALACERTKDPSVRLVFCGPCNATHKCRRGGRSRGHRVENTE